MTNISIPRSIVLLCGILICRFLEVEATWVDPDTPESHRATDSLYSEDSRKYELVFSDEFEQDGRTFNDGNDPRWTALHKNDCEYILHLI